MQYPWLQQHWEHLSQQIRIGHVSHALLLSGPEGLGQQDFALSLATFALCESPKTDPCGQCPSCHWQTQGTHPDFRLLTPAEDKKQISVQQVRETIHWLSQTPNFSSRQVVVIHPAEAMNRAAANALLKTLEEPAGDVLLLLVSHLPHTLPATIRSRCQQHVISPPAYDMALSWLQSQLNDNTHADVALSLSGGLPLTALTLIENNVLEQRDMLLKQLLALKNGQLDVCGVAADWSKQDSILVLNLLTFIVMDLIHAHFSIKEAWWHNIDRAQPLVQLHRGINVMQLYKILETIFQVQTLIRSNSNLNATMLFEKLCLTWMDVC